MSQTWIIAHREYMQRIRSKAFIIATALGPILMLAMLAIPIVAAVFATEGGSHRIALVDRSGAIWQYLDFPENFEVEISDADPDSLRARVDRGSLHGYLILPDDLLDGTGQARFYSEGGGGLMLGEQLSSAVTQAVRHVRIVQSGAPEAVLGIVSESVNVEMIKLTDSGEEADGTQAFALFGYFMGFLIYICVLLYGAMVMRGVIEEKTNRISELIASSARPFDLMMGKVMGIGAVGVTQWLIWIVAGTVLAIAAGGIVAGLLPSPEALSGDMATDVETMNQVGRFIPDIPASFLLYFLLFFLGGYLLYSSLMAAIGSAVEQESDAQQFMWIVVMPLIIPTVLMFNIMSSPDGTLAVLLSHIPLFSPIVMVVRMAATNVPWWEIWLSLALLAAAFVGAIWLSARIYRVGILSYGKKPTFAELGRWMRQA